MPASKHGRERIEGDPTIVSTDHAPVTRLRGFVLVAAVYLVVVLAIAGPIVLALLAAQNQSVRRQQERADFLATEVLARMDHIRSQITEALAALAASGAADPCGPANLVLMRTIAAGSHYLAGLGHIAEDRLRCSSFGLHDDGIAVGTPDYTSPAGLQIRQNRELSIAPGVALLLTTDLETGFSSLTSPGLSIAIAQDQEDVSVGAMAYSVRRVLINRGDFDPRWFEQMDDDVYEGVIHDGRHLGVWKRSRTGNLFTYAVISTDTVTRDMRRMTLYMVPIGAGIGVVLLAAAFLLAKRQTSIRSLLKTGLRRDELLLVYQPIVDLKTGRWIGAEALVRWHRTDGERIDPDVFIPIAEKHGMMESLTLKIIDLASGEIAAFVRDDPDFFVSINLSGSDFESARVLAALKGMAGRNGIAVRNVHVEATERAIIDTEAVKAAIKELRGIGFKVAIDDFGTGYSNLALLDRNTFDYLKIDKSFVDTIASGSATSQVIAHIIDLAGERNLVMIAEGVETQEQADYLREHGVQFGQGWLFGKPLPFDEFVSRLRLQTQPAGSDAGPVRQA